MDIYAIICTRSREQVTQTTNTLLTYLAKCGIKVFLLADTKSLFSSYERAYKMINPNPEDIIIFCHDDIEIREDPEVFKKKLIDALEFSAVGFVGPAGTTCLGPDAVWWNIENWQAGKHRGRVTHLDKLNKEYVSPYGAPGEVVCLDGLFLAAKPKVIEDVGLSRPEFFEGEWDFYDIHYTTQAHLKGYSNQVIDLNILHNSRGELVGRESWHKNREAFIANNDLPIELKE
jgi:hypothetical protein